MAETVTLPVLSQARERVGEVEVPAALVSGPLKPHLLQQVVVSQLAARRAGTAATKTKGFVSGGGKKPWKQKGTGRARQGSIRATQWKGGGKPFGPTPRHYDKAMPRQMRRQVPLGGVEVVRRDVRPGRVVVPERLDQHVLVRLVQAAGPVEPQAPRFCAGGLGEGLADGRPVLGVLGADGELRGDEDHQSPLR